ENAPASSTFVTIMVISLYTTLRFTIMEPIGRVTPTVGVTGSLIKPILGSCSFGKEKLTTTAIAMNTITNITLTAVIFSRLLTFDILCCLFRLFYPRDVYIFVCVNTEHIIDLNQRQHKWKILCIAQLRLGQE